MKIFIGDIGSARASKQEMPMLGGFFTSEPFKIERKNRLAGGKLVTDVIAIKNRIIITFGHIRQEDYDVWVSQQRFNEFREIEYEGADETYTKLVVDFEINHSQRRSKTNKDPWLYNEVMFIFEEV